MDRVSTTIKTNPTNCSAHKKPAVTTVKKICLGELKSFPQLIQIQNGPVGLYVNQAAKSEDIRDRRSLKLGIVHSSEEVFPPENTPT